MNALAIPRTDVGARRAAVHPPHPRARRRAVAPRRRSSTPTGRATRTRRSPSASRASPPRSPRSASRRARRSRVMDWDSHRYLECFFAVPMMGAVLHTVNVRISPEQILYTINHAQDDVILVNAEFLPILEAIHDKIRPGVQARADQRRRGGAAVDASRSPPSTRRCSPRADRRRTRSPSSTRTRARRRSTRPARPACPRACITAIASSCCTRWRVAQALAQRAACDVHRARRLHADHADVPRARVGAALRRDDAGREAGLPGPLRAGRAARPHRPREASRSRTACRRSCR